MCIYVHIDMYVDMLCSWALKGLKHCDFGAYACTILMLGPAGMYRGQSVEILAKEGKLDFPLRKCT